MTDEKRAGEFWNEEADCCFQSFISKLRINGLSDDQYTVIQTADEKVIITGKEFSFNIQYRFEGSIKVYEIRRCPVFDNNQNLIGIISIGRKISSQPLPDETFMLDMEQRCMLVSHSMNIGFWELDVATNKYFVNASWLKSIGYGKYDFSFSFDADCHTIIHPDDYSMFKNKITEYIHERKGFFSIELRIRRNDLSYIWTRTTGTVRMKDGRDQLLKVCGIVENIEEAKRQSTKLHYALLKTREAERLKTRILANISHEIRTPLNSILGFSKLITDEQLDNVSKREYIQIIDWTTQKFLLLIDNLIDLSKLQSDSYLIRKSYFNVYQFCKKIEEEVRGLLYKDRKVVFYLKDDFLDRELMIDTDYSAMRKILLNLLSNAIKFTQTGEISFGYEYIINQGIYFYVNDTGRGIDQKFGFSAFEPFEQEQADMTREYDGAGVGLSVVYRLVKELGGTVGFESKIGEGSFFSFFLSFNDSN